MSDGLVEIRLGKDWLASKHGETVRVDPRRAAWLRDNGYEALVEEPESAPATRHRRKGVAANG